MQAQPIRAFPSDISLSGRQRLPATGFAAG
jgi:hypothetical protein